MFNYPQWLRGLNEAAFASIAQAGETALSIHASLINDDESVLSAWLAGGGNAPIAVWGHYPPNDCEDPDSGSMVYYHAHDPADWQRDEHGHFHLFVRADEADKSTHVLAVSMSPQGVPHGLFATNAWVTDEHMLPAADLLRLLDTQWAINRARPSWLVLKWLEALLVLTRPWTEELLLRRDRLLGWAQGGEPRRVVLEDRRTHVLSELPIDWIGILESVQAEALLREKSSCRNALRSC